MSVTYRDQRRQGTLDRWSCKPTAMRRKKQVRECRRGRAVADAISAADSLSFLACRRLAGHNILPSCVPATCMDAGMGVYLDGRYTHPLQNTSPPPTTSTLRPRSHCMRFRAASCVVFAAARRITEETSLACGQGYT